MFMGPYLSTCVSLNDLIGEVVHVLKPKYLRHYDRLLVFV